MRKSTPHNPIMIAYMIFIFICVFWYLICKLTGLDFEMWNKILIGVAIASYFFSLNSINRNIVKTNESIKQLLYENRNLLNDMIKDLAAYQTLKTEDFKDWQSELSNELEECEEKLKKVISSLLKQRKTVLIIDVVGFLAFFMILGIDGFYMLFVNTTDVVTLLAFLTVLFVDYMENIMEVKSEEKIKIIKDLQQELLQRNNK